MFEFLIVFQKSTKTFLLEDKKGGETKHKGGGGVLTLGPRPFSLEVNIIIFILFFITFSLLTDILPGKRHL